MLAELLFFQFDFSSSECIVCTMHYYTSMVSFENIMFDTYLYGLIRIFDACIILGLGEGCLSSIERKFYYSVVMMSDIICRILIFIQPPFLSLSHTHLFPTFFLGK